MQLGQYALSLRTLPSRLGALLVCLSLVQGLSFAQDVARIPVRIVNGRLVVRCDLSSGKRIPCNLFIDYDNPCELEIHNKAAAGIECESGERAFPITIHLPNLNIVVPRRELGDEESLEKFTKWYSKELGENSVVGTIGANLLKKYHVTFDLRQNFIELSDPRPVSNEPPAEEPGSYVQTVTLRNDLVWMPVRYGDGEPTSMALGTSRFDSTVDQDLCEELGHPAGNIGPIKFLGLDLHSFVAFRPAEINYVHADGALGVTGLGLLLSCRVEVDRANRSVRFTQTAEADYPEEDLAFFRAMVEEEPEPVLAYLKEHPKVRLSREAADLLIDLYLSYGAEEESWKEAIRWVNDTRIEDLKATEALELMGKLEASGFPQWVIEAGRHGVEAGRDDRYPNAVHEVHSKMGVTLLELGEGKEAWRSLLSAAFGLPEDGVINLNLGRFYEQEGRYQRAFSRYVQAVISPESGQEALVGLERVQPLLEDGESMSVDLVEKLVSGKVEGFGAATKFQATEFNSSNRCVLAEFFTNANFKAAIGGALGRQGLLSHFEPEHVAFVAYHVPGGSLDALITPIASHMAQSLGVPGPQVHVFNGVSQGPGAGRSRFKERIYNACREKILEQLVESTEYDVRIEAKLEDGVVKGQVIAEGPGDPGLMLNLLLVERGVLYPGESKVVIHKMVARAALTPLLGGVRYEPVGGTMAYEFSGDLAQIQADNEAYLDELEADGLGTVAKFSTAIDPRQVSLVAFIRDGNTMEVLQAAQLNLSHDDED